MPKMFAIALAAAVTAVVPAAVVPAAAPDPTPPVPSIGSYTWPVQGAVIRQFEQPAGPYSAGHRGIDIAASAASPVVAASAGVVAFAGRVGGEQHVSVDHPDGVRTSYSFLSAVAVRAGDPVERGEVVGSTGPGHAGFRPEHVHFGARFAGVYIDPMLLLSRRSLVGLIRLAPIEDAKAAG